MNNFSSALLLLAILIVLTACGAGGISEVDDVARTFEK